MTTNSDETIRVVPFLKWAGGKRWLISSYPEVFPSKFNRYIEPFLGSGAVFFHLKPREALLSDVNADLLNTYGVVRNRWRLLEKALSVHQRLHSDTYYYKLRSSLLETNLERAARFIYLNRTCWNGLYRVNKQGQFNVPRGSKDSVLLDTDTLGLASKCLKKAILQVSDFELSVDEANRGDFLFVDPPYTVKHNHNGFIKYNDKIFSWDDQVRLRDAIFRAKSRGAFIVMTNANHESVRELYKKFQQRALQRHSVLSGSVAGRGATEELLVTSRV